MSAELAGYAVKIAVRRLVTFQTAGFILESVFKLVVPGAFKHLKSLLDDLGALSVRLTFSEREYAVFHFLGGGKSREAKSHGFAEILFVVRNKIERGFFGAQNILRRIGTVAALQNHGVTLLARDVIRKAQRIRAEIGLSALRNCRDKQRRHGKIRRRLIKIIHYSYVFELVFHDFTLFFGIFRFKRFRFFVKQIALRRENASSLFIIPPKASIVNTKKEKRLTILLPIFYKNQRFVLTL